VLGTAEWTLRPVEVNVATLDAGAVLAEIVAGRAPWELLALISLMHSGGDPGIVAQWCQLVGAETEPQRRADAVLAKVFAGRLEHPDAWHNALTGFSRVESPLLAELLAEAKSDALLRVLRKRHGELPEDLVAAVRACTNGAQLDRWLDVAGEAPTLAQFRQQAACKPLCHGSADLSSLMVRLAHLTCTPGETGCRTDRPGRGSPDESRWSSPVPQ
jgi:hypothetical protein